MAIWLGPHPYKITAVVTTFSDTIGDYLKYTLESLLSQEGVDLEVILVSSQNIDPLAPPNVKVFKQPRNKSNCQNVNFGFRQARPESTLFFTVNDDVILSKNSLKSLAETSSKNYIANAMSNNDNHWLYLADFKVGDLVFPRYCRVDDRVFKELAEAVMGYSLENNGLPTLLLQHFVCTYATMVPRKIWEDLEGYDDKNLGVAGTDVDFCLRARQLGVQSVVTNQAFIFHAGGVTSSETLNDTIRAKDRELFKAKWGFDAP